MDRQIFHLIKQPATVPAQEALSSILERGSVSPWGWRCAERLGVMGSIQAQLHAH